MEKLTTQADNDVIKYGDTILIRKDRRAMITSPQEYIDSIAGLGKEWLIEFFHYMEQHHGDIKPVMFRQRPMYKVGKSYIMFTAAKDYFSMHTLNFELINELKRQLPGSGNGKGCVNIKYTNIAAKPILKTMCDKIIELNQSPDAPPVDVVPELPYEDQLAKTFSHSKAKWKPLYLTMLSYANNVLPEFHEYFPAVGVLWKHTCTFAGIKCTKKAMQIEIYSDSFHPERNPVKSLQTSTNRVMHLIEITDNSSFDLIFEWINESYYLTRSVNKEKSKIFSSL